MNCERCNSMWAPRLPSESGAIFSTSRSVDSAPKKQVICTSRWSRSWTSLNTQIPRVKEQPLSSNTRHANIPKVGRQTFRPDAAFV